MSRVIRRFPADSAEAIEWRRIDDMLREAAAASIAVLAEGQQVIAVCGWHSFFDDDEFRFCQQCKRSIVCRPWQPADAIRVCIACGLSMRAEDEAAEDGA